MSKLLLFVCLVLFGTVLGQTQIRLLNAKYVSTLVVGITPDTNLVGNTTITDGVASKFDTPSPVFPASGYISLPLYEFTVGTELTLYAFDRDNFPEGPVDTFTSLENVTLVELQSYSLIYVGETEDFAQERVSISDRLLLVEERPNPSPVGKALVRIVNAAISTFEPATNMEAVVNGTGVADRLVSLAFGEASEFLEFDTAGTLKLYTSLPAAEGTTRSRTIEFTTAIGFTTMVYIRGDLSSPSQLGETVNNVEFAFPAAPSAPVAAPTAPVAAPVAGPTAPTAPTAPVAAPVATPTRAPTRRVSSAATTVAQIAGVAVVVSLLF